MDVSKVDPNFSVDTEIEKEGLVFHNVRNNPFVVYGLLYENGKFRRMPEAVALEAEKDFDQPEGIARLHAMTAGGRVRFITDSPFIAIHAKMGEVGRMNHFALTGSAGFDMYVRMEDEERYIKTFVPYDLVDHYESIHEFDTPQMREITIHFPPYSEVCELYIGLLDGCTLTEPRPYRVAKPIVYYGSSITQGGCASRPGNIYSNIISRCLSAVQINLGFSGNGKGEPTMARYIAALDMSAFVLDYDHNAFHPEHLRKTHEPFFKAVRAAHPDIPIVMCSRPRWYLTPEEEERREVIYTTYQNALKNGDNHVFFLDGRDLMALCGNEGTVDGCHPTDFGFHSMANAIGDVLKKVL